ncbi:hypothetical protein DVA67_005730 [Solirubrobacter sp. CPCC 204708]|uniref:Uncharacterized protein n=1 Tax=Solirubrobacter deserti TaxID=2282478 RepID=A0ABT4RGM0_9ACTN|nr:hypothetical protein [Solirubrobacter deserti]MBE2315465.1 hypothetical protein [Solirubrobacter deserti]MDA0137692.1 hypothetical protein [Solirubrobacter deserti]
MSEQDLYALPLEEFISARDKLAKEIRKSDKEAAAKLAKLPKPTPAAWTANQVAREEPELIAALLDAGAALRAAQDAALAGGGADVLRQATQAERRAIDDVMRFAVTLKPGGKPLSRAMADRLRTTLHAAAGDPDLRAALQAGRLVGEAQQGGAWPFALETTDLPAPPPKKQPKQPPPEEVDRQAEERAARERQQLEDELREARATLKVRERVAKGAEEDAQEAVDTLQRAQEAFEEAKQALADARSEAETAERVLTGARKERDRARDTVARLEERLD